MFNGGGRWDNGKKCIEEANNCGKGRDSHMAAVPGESVGDPY